MLISIMNDCKFRVRNQWIQKWNRHFVFVVFSFVFLFSLFFYGGCQLAVGMIGILSSPSRGEKTIRAEYNLKKESERKILVIVEQPGWLRTQENLRLIVTEAINESLIQRVQVSAELIISYDRLSEFRSGRGDFAMLSPSEVGSALGADLVVFVILGDYQVDGMSEQGYYKGFLSAQAAVFDVSSGEKVWPAGDEDGGKAIQVGFEIEHRGRKAAVKRLAGAVAFCTTRYFSDCPADKFKIAEDRSGPQWADWEK